ncbi:MAG TPA: hypothetical protein VIV12_06290 [Streptosporangiaceae bacterium]
MNDIAPVIPLGPRRPHRDPKAAVMQMAEAVLARNEEIPMNDHDALVSLLRRNGCPNADVIAMDIEALLRARSWRKAESHLPPPPPRPANPEQVAARIAEARAAIHGKDQT